MKKYFQEESLVFSLLVVYVASMLISLAVLQSVSILLIILWLFYSIRDKKNPIEVSPFTLPFVAYVGLRVVSIFLSEHIEQSIPLLWTEIPFYGMFFVLIYYLSKIEREKSFKLINILLVTVFIVLCIAVGKYLLGYEKRISALTSGFTTYATFSAAIFGFVLFRELDNTLITNRMKWGIFLTGVLIAILLTFSRMQWIIVSIFIFFYGIFRNRLVGIMMVGVLLAALLFSTSLVQRAQTLLDPMQNTSGRKPLWIGAERIAFEHPVFGFGPETFRTIFPDIKTISNAIGKVVITSWENSFLQIYMESGIITLLALLWLIGTIYRKGYLLAAHLTKATPERNYIIALMGGISALFLSGLTSAFILSPINTQLLWFMLALLSTEYMRLFTTTTKQERQ